MQAPLTNKPYHQSSLVQEMSIIEISSPKKSPEKALEPKKSPQKPRPSSTLAICTNIIFTTPKPWLPPKAYTLLQGRAVLLHNISCQNGVLTLAVGRERYIKLRNIGIENATATAVQDSGLLPFGPTPSFQLRLNDLYKELSAHRDVAKFGLFESIDAVFRSFLQECERKTPQLVVQSTSKIHYKPTTEMETDGTLAVIEKKLFRSGSTKNIYKTHILWPQTSSPTCARSKLINHRLNPSELKKLDYELQTANFFKKNAVPYVITMSKLPSQDCRKIRIGMPFRKNDLASLLYKPPFPTWKKLLTYMYQIAQSLTRIHKWDLLHNDVKLQNCLLNEELDQAELCDFGLVGPRGGRNLAGTFPAPEFATSGSIVRQKTTPANDCWAFGLALFGMLRGYPLYNDLVLKADWKLSREQLLAIRESILLTLDLKDPEDTLLSDLLSIEPTQRPSMESTAQRIKSILSTQT
jgi:hypothetical protein